MNLQQLFLVSLLIESLVQTIKPIYDKETGWNKDLLMSLGISVLVCVLSGIDLFKLVGMGLMLPYVGSVLTGVLFSRGANVTHDLIQALYGASQRVLSK